VAPPEIREGAIRSALAADIEPHGLQMLAADLIGVVTGSSCVRKGSPRLIR
jgi:hypothetical protein